MKSKGFFITEIRLTGRNKKDASVLLKKGLNVISGASDTGKTYIFQLINYMFGGADEPKEIDESIGYSTIFLEIETYEGESFTLSREIGESWIYVYESKINDISVLQHSVKLKAKHDKDDEDNISTFLLSLTGIQNMLLRKNARGAKHSFSFRYLVALIMLNEEKIISENIPIFSGIPTNKTTEQSAFKTILTGIDDSLGEELEDPKIYRTRLEGKLEFVNSLLQKLKLELKEQQVQVLDYNANELALEIKNLMNILSNTSKEINLRMEKKKEIWTQEQEIKSRILMLDELLERFRLLEKSYLSDLDRLQFLIEGDYYISQLFDSNCPVCNNPFGPKTTEHNHNFYLDDLQIACFEESNKIKAQLTDLRETLNNLHNENHDNNKKADSLSQQVMEIEESIQRELKPVAVLTKEKMDNLMNAQKTLQEIELNERRVTEYQANQLEILRELSKKNQKMKFNNEITTDIYDDFASEIKKLLEGWNYPDLTSVSIDPNDQELIVSGKKRKNHGKGYRAILNAAFIIAIMNYTRSEELKHPGLIILDSPLTTYKEKVNQVEPTASEEDVPLDMKQAFFKNLSELQDNLQIIIFENIDPVEEVQNNMNYIHFSKVNGVGRYGFIPIDSNAKSVSNSPI